MVKNMNSIELTTMCAILDVAEKKVLCINRNRTWTGWAFPGGHLEHGECFFQCAKREMEEETGIRLSDYIFKGVVNIFNTKTHTRHIIMNYIAHHDGESANNVCNEGEIAWISRSDFEKIPLAEGMELRLQIFFEPGIKELYIEWDETRGYTKVEVFDM